MRGVSSQKSTRKTPLRSSEWLNSQISVTIKSKSSSQEVIISLLSRATYEDDLETACRLNVMRKSDALPALSSLMTNDFNIPIAQLLAFYPCLSTVL